MFRLQVPIFAKPASVGKPVREAKGRLCSRPMIHCGILYWFETSSRILNMNVLTEQVCQAGIFKDIDLIYLHCFDLSVQSDFTVPHFSELVDRAVKAILKSRPVMLIKPSRIHQ